MGNNYKYTTKVSTDTLHGKYAITFHQNHLWDQNRQDKNLKRWFITFPHIFGVKILAQALPGCGVTEDRYTHHHHNIPPLHRPSILPYRVLAQEYPWIFPSLPLPPSTSTESLLMRFQPLNALGSFPVLQLAAVLVLWSWDFFDILIDTFTNTPFLENLTPTALYSQRSRPR